MITKLYIFLAFLNVTAKTVFTTSEFTIASKVTTFYSYEDKNITGSEKCIENNDECSNYKFLKTVSLSKAKATLAGGKNPGAEICKNMLNGTIVVGTDKKFNENSFCKLANGIIVDNGTLTYYGLVNDKGLDAANNRRTSKGMSGR